MKLEKVNSNSLTTFFILRKEGKQKSGHDCLFCFLIQADELHSTKNEELLIGIYLYTETNS